VVEPRSEDDLTPDVFGQDDYNNNNNIVISDSFLA